MRTVAGAGAGTAPVVHPETAEFWAAIEDGAFRLQRCTGCGTVRFPPAPVCWQCLGTGCTLADVSGQGTVAVSIVVERVTSGSVWAGLVPYRTGLVDLAAGIRVPGRIICRCGQAASPGAAVSVCRLTAADGRHVFGFSHSCVEVPTDGS